MLPILGPLTVRGILSCALIFGATAVWAEPARVEDGAPLASPQMEHRLQRAIQWYRSIREQHEGLPIGQRVVSLSGADSRRQLRHRLTVTGDYRRSARDENSTTLALAVAKFQRRHGLSASGQVDRATLAAMNVPIATRIDQLQDALEKVRELRRTIRDTRYIQVNIAAQELSAIANGVTALTSTVIIGRRDRQTPVMMAPAIGVDFFPTWRVPLSIIKSDLFPRIADDPGYFSRNDYLIMDDDGQQLSPAQVRARGLESGEIRIHRRPGPRNPLGRIRINMPNNRAIFLHDTPGLIQYAWPDRALSYGCVRVSRIVELAAWLLSDSGWSLERVSAVLRAGRAHTGWLIKPVPVHLIYMTSWVDFDANGRMQVQFRPDVYGLTAS